MNMKNINSGALGRIFSKSGASSSTSIVPAGGPSLVGPSAPPKTKRKGGFSLKKHWKAFVVTGAAIVTLTTLVAGAILLKPADTDNAALGDDGGQVIAAVVDNEEENEDDFEFSLLADSLDLDGLTMTDNLTDKIEAAVDNEHQAVAPGPVFAPGDVHFDGNGTAWVSEEDKDKFEAGPIVEEFNGYVAPDGILWESEEAYLAVQNNNAGQNGTAVYEEGWVGPDGTVWRSEADYNANNTAQTTVDNSGYYYDAASNTWYITYEDYLRDQEIQSGSQTQGQNQATDQGIQTYTTDQGQGTVQQDNNGYYYDAASDTWYMSYEDYLAANGANVTTSQDGQTYSGGQGQGTTTVQQENNDFYYDAASDTWYMSYEDYLASKGTGTSYDTGTGNTQQQQDPNSGLYTVNDGSEWDGTVWASRQDYLDFLALTSEKSR